MDSWSTFPSLDLVQISRWFGGDTVREARLLAQSFTFLHYAHGFLKVYAAK